jgi:hypothetical protein
MLSFFPPPGIFWGGEVLGSLENKGMNFCTFHVQETLRYTLKYYAFLLKKKSEYKQ